MSKQSHQPAPVPPGNRPNGDPRSEPIPDEIVDAQPDGSGFHEQDVKRRLGSYGGAGEHPIQQPGNDGKK